MQIKTAKKLLANIRFSQGRNVARNDKGQNLTVWNIDLTDDDLIKKYDEQNGQCYWSKKTLNEEYNYINKHPLAISVDRIDNRIGYEYNNVVLTLRLFNLGRGSYAGNFAPIVDFIYQEENNL